MWFNLAGASGLPNAFDLRDATATLMTRDQIAEAQRRAHEWKPKTSRLTKAFGSPVEVKR
jgi:hypothetical protein